MGRAVQIQFIFFCQVVVIPLVASHRSRIGMDWDPGYHCENSSTCFFFEGTKGNRAVPEVPVSEVNLAGAAAKTGCFAWSAGSCVVAPCLKGVLPARLAHSFVGVPETECIFNS